MTISFLCVLCVSVVKSDFSVYGDGEDLGNADARERSLHADGGANVVHPGDRLVHDCAGDAHRANVDAHE